MASERSGSDLIKSLLILAYLLSCGKVYNSVILPPVTCSLQTEIIQVDPTNNRYVPLFVKLHRCRGSVANIKPTIKHCVPTTETTLTAEVTDTTDPSSTTFQLKNHTACGPACVGSSNDCNSYQSWSASSCLCQCQYTSEPDPPCANSYVWNQQRCNCEASPGVSSSVKANHVSSSTGGVKESIVILMMALEFLVLTVLFAVFYRFCLQKEDSQFFAMTASVKRKLSRISNHTMNSAENNTSHDNATPGNCIDMKPVSMQDIGSHNQAMDADGLISAANP